MIKGKKKVHTRNLITIKKFPQLENFPPSPHNVSNGLVLFMSFFSFYEDSARFALFFIAPAGISPRRRNPEEAL